jgi:putative Holliday junction resolvase
MTTYRNTPTSSPQTSTPDQGRWIAIDHGQARIGIALSDPHGLFARPHSIIYRGKGVDEFAALQTIIEQSEVTRIIVGLPTSSTGGISAQATIVIHWVRQLAKIVKLPILLWDESYSSEDALAMQRASGKRKSKDVRKRKPLDDVAAAAILQDYLNSRGVDYEPGQTLEAFADIE